MNAFFVILLFVFIILLSSNIIEYNNFFPSNFNTSFRNTLLDFNEGFQDGNKHDLAVSGFNGIFKDANGNYKNQIDSISLRHGSKTCPDTMLTNSMGYLCLTNDEMNLLKTRGGNDI